MPPHFCTSASDIVADMTGSIAGFRFLGWLVVEIECDDGTVGIGNAALAPHATKTTIDTYLKPLLIGTDPLDSEYLWQSMYRRTLPFGRKGIGMTAISAVDLAVWDAKGKILEPAGVQAARRPHKGEDPGLCQPPLQPAARQPLRRGEGLCGAGLPAVKLRFGWGPKDGVAGMRKNLDLVRTTREAVGPDVDIMADCYMGWNARICASACCGCWRRSICAGSRSP